MMRHARLTFPAIFSTDPQARFDQINQILDQMCRHFNGKIPALAWQPISVTSKELKTILGSIHYNSLTQGDISVIHADKKRTFGKRYTLQVSQERSNISLAVTGSRALYDLLIDMDTDGNLLLSHKALRRSAGSKKMIKELQLIIMPSGGDVDNYLYSLSYKRPFKKTAAGSTFKAVQLQRLSLDPEVYADRNNDGRGQRITGQEFEKMFNVELLQKSSADDDIILDLKNIHSAYRRLQMHIDGHIAFDAGVKNDSLQDVSQKSLLETILAQAKKQFPARVVIKKVSDLVGYGLMAGRPISAGTVIGEYCGEISKVSAQNKDGQDNTYFAPYAPDNVPGSELLVIDAKKCGNSMRFINHSDENSNARWVHVFDGKRFRLVIVAVKPISKGRQILLKYKDSYWSKKRGSSGLSNTPYPL